MISQKWTLLWCRHQVRTVCFYHSRVQIQPCRYYQTLQFSNGRTHPLMQDGKTPCLSGSIPASHLQYNLLQKNRGVWQCEFCQSPTDKLFLPVFHLGELYRKFRLYWTCGVCCWLL